MAYFKLNGNDFSMYVNELKVTSRQNYNAQTNAAGNTVIDYINQKREIEVGIIPLSGQDLLNLTSVLKHFQLSVTILNPNTNKEETLTCILPTSNIEFYTIQANRVMLKAFSLKFVEL